MRDRKNNTLKNVIVALLFLVIVFMTAGYAAYARELIINSTGGIINDWNLQFTDVSEYSSSSGANYENEPQIRTHEFDNDLIVDVEVSLSSPSDSISYEIEITNYSELWHAEFMEYVVSYSATNNFIVWTITGIDEGDRILNNNTVNDNSIKIILTASWNPILIDQYPEDATADWETTYKENSTITLSFMGVRP